MRQTLKPCSDGGSAALPSTSVAREPGAVLPARGAAEILVGGFRVLQSRAAPAQRSLFLPAAPRR